MAKPLIVISGYPKNSAAYEAESSQDRAPRLDYVEIARRLGGDVVGYSSTAWQPYRWVRKIESKTRLDVVEAFTTARHVRDAGVIISASEKAAIPLAMICQLRRHRNPHVVIAHHLSSRSKAYLFRIWPLQQSFTRVVCVSRVQANYAIRELGIPDDRVQFVYHSVDQLFFRPQKCDEPGDFVLTVGQEQRDFDTLVSALKGTGIKLVVVASSAWSGLNVRPGPGEHITVQDNLSYTDLRRLYSQARLVVIPLLENDYAAGASTALEAMAMAKPLIISRSQGIPDYLSDQNTGRLVQPRDTKALRELILSLWGAPKERKRLGDTARAAVEAKMSLDNYVDRLVEIVGSAASHS